MERDCDSISRVSRPKERARAFYDRISPVYDILAGGAERRLLLEGLRLLDAGPGDDVLEIGFGTGRALVGLAETVGETGSVRGIDLSEKMGRVALKRLREAGLAGRVELKAGDAAVLPFEDRSFDAAFIGFTLELFDSPEIPRVLSECVRVLRPSAKICVVSMSLPSRRGPALRVYEAMHALFPTAVDCRPIHAARSLAESGFEVVASRPAAMFRLPVDVTLALKGA